MQNIGFEIDHYVSGLRNAYFNKSVCRNYLFRKRWPEGFVCPICEGKKYCLLNCRLNTYECRACGTQTSITSGTVMHGTKLPIRVWIIAAHLLNRYPEEISIRKMMKLLRLKSYKATWLLVHKIRGSLHKPTRKPSEIKLDPLLNWHLFEKEDR